MNVRNRIQLIEMLEGMAKSCKSHKSCSDCNVSMVVDGHQICRYMKMFEDLVANKRTPNAWDLENFRKTIEGEDA